MASTGWLLVLYLLQAVQLLILARVLLSWVVSPTSRSPWVEMVRRATDPILNPIQAVLPDLGGIDLSPIVAFLLLRFLQSLVSSLAYGY